MNEFSGFRLPRGSVDQAAVDTGQHPNVLYVYVIDFRIVIAQLFSCVDRCLRSDPRDMSNRNK